MVRASETLTEGPDASGGLGHAEETRGWHPRKEALCLLILLLVTLLSRAAFVWYESLHFDSDQAVVGLMALDLARGRGFTVYYYGLGYLATVEPYLAAPLFVLFGPSRWALKFPLLLTGVAVAWMMYMAFRRDTGASPRLALLLALPFAVPSVLLASRLVEANGGNLDVFAWLMVLWFLRRRPLWLGLVAGVALQARLFCAYGLASLLIILVCRRRWKLRHYFISAAGGAGTYALVLLLARYSLNNFGGGAPVRLSNPEDIAYLFRGVCTQLIPPLFGFAPTELSRFNIMSDLVSFAGPFAIITLASLALLFVAAAGLLRHRAALRWEFPCYLMGCGLLCVVGFCTLQGNLLVDRMQVRYLLVLLWLPMGMAALLCQTRMRPVAVVALLVWCGVNVTQSAALWGEVFRRPPPDPYADLAAAFGKSEYAIGAADYDAAYYVTFLLGERKIVASMQTPRIKRHQEAFRRANREQRAVILDRQAACPQAIRVHRWTICPLPPDFERLFGATASWQASRGDDTIAFTSARPSGREGRPRSLPLE